MTGNADSATRKRPGWFARLTHMPRHYFAVDGGSGAHLLTALSQRSPYAERVASPRHANLLVVVEPISEKLVPAIVEIAQALPRPAHALLVGGPEAVCDSSTETKPADLQKVLPGSRHLQQVSVEGLLDAVLDRSDESELIVSDGSEVDSPTIQLPSRQQQEMATELAVLSLGPIQPFTAGPLRLFLICDGEQVLSVQVESGYASRGIAEAMMQGDWQQALSLARQFDPLAPIAGQLACIRAIEQLQGWSPPTLLVKLREAALALERTQNVLWWLVRFAEILDVAQLLDRSYSLASALDECSARLWQQSPTTWLLPQYSGTTAMLDKNTATLTRLRQVAESLTALQRDVERNRWPALRTRSIGMLSTARLQAANVTGPVLQASEQGEGDVEGRLRTRLQLASGDLLEVAETLAAEQFLPAHAAYWTIPAGEAHAEVKGPRGTIGLHLESSDNEKPSRIEWQSPSAALLPLLPEILAGQKLADAEVIVASLDLAMAEADG